jgi:hypothetical protein
MSLQGILKTNRRRAAILAVLALLIGQWALLAHAHEPGTTAPDHVCWLCIHAHHDGNALPSLGISVAAVPADAPQPGLASRPYFGIIPRHFNPRAPPSV